MFILNLTYCLKIHIENPKDRLSGIGLGFRGVLSPNVSGSIFFLSAILRAITYPYASA